MAPALAEAAEPSCHCAFHASSCLGSSPGLARIVVSVVAAIVASTSSCTTLLLVIGVTTLALHSRELLSVLLLLSVLRGVLPFILLSFPLCHNRFAHMLELKISDLIVSAQYGN